jgi:hypothetical protein
MTVILVVASVVIFGGSLLIVANPEVPFNPLPLPTLPPVLQIPSATPTLADTPTFTPSPTPTITPTFTPSLTPTASNTPTITWTPSHTPTSTYTPTPVLPNLPTSTPAPTNTPNPATPVSVEGIPAQPGIVTGGGSGASGFGANSPFPFVAAEPILQANENAQGCDWLGIAGSVNGLVGEPLLNFPVEIAGEDFLEVHFSGTAPAYGAGGFEVNVGNAPRRATFALRLLGVTGEPLSDYVYVETGDTCQTNVVVVVFQQVRGY